MVLLGLLACSADKTADLHSGGPVRIAGGGDGGQEVSEFPTACKFGIYSIEQTNIRDRVVLSNGNVGSAQHVEVGVEAQVPGTIVSAANVFLRDRSTVNDVFAASSISKQNQVTVTGEEDSGLDIPADALETRVVPTGTQHHTLTGGQQLTLEPGTYGDMHLHSGATLSLAEGVYNFRKLVLEAGTTTLRFAPDSGFIEINADQELRFGDRNQFVLEDDASPTQVQFYTNSPQQVKVGTDSVFNGVITAPNAQVYVFSRVEFNGALYGKSVWIDTDTRVNLHPNCTSYNMVTEEQIIRNMCDALSFEQDPWSSVDAFQTAELKTTALFVSAGNDSLELRLNSDEEAEVEVPMAIQFPFDADDGAIDVKLDVLSDAFPASEWGATISLHGRAEDGSEWHPIGVFAYDHGSSHAGPFSTVEGTLPQALSSALHTETGLRFRISVAAQQSDATFWLDNLRLCSDTKGCNPGCPEVPLGAVTVPGLVSTDLELRFSDDDVYLVTGQTELSGSITNSTEAPVSGIHATLIFSNPFGEQESLTAFTGSIEGEATQAFSVSASQIPFVDEYAINQVALQVTADQGDAPLPIESSILRYYRHDVASGTITHFGNKAFMENFDATRYQVPADQYAADTGSTENRVVLIRFRPYPGSLEEPGIDTDSDSNVDTAIPIE